MGKSKAPAPPATPDYRGAAIEQGAANIETARLQGRMNNPNISGPLGGQTVTFGANDQPTVTQTLTPQAQATLESQQRVEQSLANLGEEGVGTAQNVLRSAFNPNLQGLQTNIADAGQIAQAPNLGLYGSASGGPQGGQYGSAGGGPGSGAYGMAGANVQAGGINQGPQAGQYGFADRNLNVSNVAAMPVNAGTTGQQAIMNRLAPELDRQSKATEQRLANQGLVAGGEAYENAMISQNQQKNDLLSQAALQGIGLDTAANAQGFGQALQAGQYGNQAVAQNFSQAQAAQAAQNAAQQQGFAQQFGLAGLQNQAIGQNFAQGQTAQQLQNAGIGQNFAQGQAANAAGNQAVGQNQQAALQQQQASNAAQNQQYNQLMQRAQFGNTAQQQSLQQQLALRNQPLNEIAGLMSGSQIQMPQFQGYQGANVAGTPIMQGAIAQGGANMDAYGIQSANVNAKNAGTASLLGSAATAGATFF